jgi:hypothetical protein
MPKTAVRSAAAAALPLALVLAPAAHRPAVAVGSAGVLKPLQPKRIVKPADGYFADAFAVDAGARHAAVVRTDGATFAKLEIVDLATGAVTASADVPGEVQALDRLEVLPDAKGVVVIARVGSGEITLLSAWLVDPAGRVAGKVGPAAGFGRPARSPDDRGDDLLIAFDRKTGEGGAATYTVTPHQLATLAPLGKPRVYRAGAGGEVKGLAVRLLGFFDGYARAVGERVGAAPRDDGSGGGPPTTARMVVVNTLTGKITDEAEVADATAWMALTRQRLEHPDRGVFAALNPDDGGVDIVDAMGRKQPAKLAVPFNLYDPKSLRDQEGPEQGAFYFSIAVDPLNADAVKRRKPDLPMLDLYAADLAKGLTAPRLRGRVFTPRPVSWRAGYDKLVVLKRLRSFSRGGDELQVYDLH